MVFSLRVLTEPASVRNDRRELAERARQVQRALSRLEARERDLLVHEAARMAEIRARLGTLTGTPSSCRTCAHRLPGGRPDFAGGHCCGGDTAGYTPERELAPLALAGTRLWRARATDTHHGCMFRAPEGCTLPARDRPSMCLRYLCRELMSELARRGVLAEVLKLAEELEAGVRRIGEHLGMGSGI